MLQSTNQIAACSGEGGAMSGQHCLTLNRSGVARPPTLEELLQGNSERGKLYHAVLKKLRENTALSSGNHQRHVLPIAASTPAQNQSRRSQPYCRPVMKTPQLTPLSSSQPPARYNHPYSRTSSSAAVRPGVGPYATLSSPTVQPAHSAPPVLLQNRVDVIQCGAHHTSAAATTPLPPPDGATPMETPTGGFSQPVHYKTRCLSWHHTDVYTHTKLGVC